MKIFTLICVGFFSILPISALAEPSDDAMREWWALPEKQNLKIPCSTDLQFATDIANQRSHGATIVTLLRWAESNAEKITAEEKAAGKYTPDEYLPVGLDISMIKLIQRVDFDRPIYSQIPGGFPQWVYKSCLKGKPLD